ncbi:MAG: Inositol-1-monophosphatase [uncultured Thermomicrobiales bacterium]|uniref:Inositol-1-monophosphatase n=1 Tax=uncultured Thermomicrobiales bacterium TaxID=1645740 RepID=A0A6J4VJG4_9BACT|nr:MAG: Inositol-1-monophosphatase [uncultured Thermomicrobiales bacterium]
MTDAFLPVAVAAAREAGALLRERFGRPHDVRLKGAVDLVTEADTGAEALIAARLRAAFPDHRLLGEEGARGAEGGGSGAVSPYGWVVDPLDGTTNYAHGFPHFAVSIALERDGAPLVGVVYDPIRDELFAAASGAGATLNGGPIRVSATDRPIAAMLATGFAYDLAERGAQAVVWRSLLDRVQSIRQTGSAALNLAYVAAGRLDGYWERPLRPWDMAAGALLVTEAGGRVTDPAGGPFDPYGDGALATNGPLHASLLAAIAGTGG